MKTKLPHTPLSPLRVNDSGLALVTVAIGMLLLVSLAAVAVDGSNLYRERGDTQNAADLAAYAAAYDDCTGGDDPVAVGMAQAAANGFTHDGNDTIVTVAEEGGDWRATVDSTIDGFFSKALGADAISTHATALALCTISVVSDYAMFAGGACGPETLKWSGSDNDVTGDIHSNDGVSMSGSDNTVNGNATATGSFAVGGSGNVFNPSQDDDVDPRDWPVMFNASDFLPGGPVQFYVGSAFYHYWPGKIDTGVLSAQGWWDPVTKTLDTGVYVATDDIDLSVSDFNGTVTLVTAPSGEEKGVITLSGSDQDLQPFYKSLLVFSDAWNGGTGYPWDPEPPAHPSCLQLEGIRLSGSNHIWSGIMLAPRSGVVLSGSVNITVNGSIISYHISISGGAQQISFTGGLGVDPEVVLVE